MPTSKPQARRAEIVIQELTDETLVYDLKSHQAHCLNHTASLVWKSCDGKRSAADIARLLARQNGGPASEEVVWLALRQLGERRLLAEKLTLPSMMAGLSRRAVVRRLGLGAAATLPLVTSILAPRAVNAQTATPCAMAGRTFCVSEARFCSEPSLIATFCGPNCTATGSSGGVCASPDAPNATCTCA